MHTVLLNWRMTLRRRTATLLTVAFTCAMTVFLLAYPSLIRQVQEELDRAYDTLPVEGWIINAAGYEDPEIPAQVWKPILETGLLKDWRARGETLCEAAYPQTLQAVYQDAYPGAPWPPPESLMSALLSVAVRVKDGGQRDTLVVVNAFSSDDDLLRIREQIDWAEGYGPECLSGSEPVCLLPADMGYAPGETIFIRVYPSKEGERRYHHAEMRVAGIYPVRPLAGVLAYCPLAALEDIFNQAEWKLSLSAFSFTPADNRQLPELKAALRELGLSGEGEKAKLRAAIDDRVLQGTVAPIKSNLGLLKGLYGLFFDAVGLIGFFLCFLQAKGRKTDYAVMRLLGEPAAQVTFKALLEQAALCAAGVILGTAALAISGAAVISPLVCAGVLLCYTVGAGIAVLMTVQVNVMEILRDKE